MVALSAKLVFLLLRALIAIEGLLLFVQAAVEFLAAAAGDVTPLFLSTMFIGIGAGFLYLAFGIRSRASTPYYATLGLAVFGILLVASLGGWTATRILMVALAAAIIVMLVLLRRRFQLRPGEIVKEEKLPHEVAVRIATKIRGVRCRECGDDDVWITSDKLLVCRNCGTTNA